MTSLVYIFRWFFIFLSLSVTVIAIAGETKIRKPAESGRGYGEGDLIPRYLRENVFLKAGLAGDVATLDEMERDILIMAIWKKPLSEVFKKYPKIDFKKIKEARKLIIEAVK